jgi:hypothetical protein
MAADFQKKGISSPCPRGGWRNIRHAQSGGLVAKFFCYFSWSDTGAGIVVISSSAFKEASILTAEAVPSRTSLLETAEARPRQSPLGFRGKFTYQPH